MTPPDQQNLDEELVAEALRTANIPTLLMVLYQLTDRESWLEDPYRPLRARGMSENDTGGLAIKHQKEVRAAALDAILAWGRGKPVAIPEPSDEQLIRMLSVAVGEEVPPEYGEFTAAQFGRVSRLAGEPLDVPEGLRVLIIGAGLSGLCAAINLQTAGIPFVIVEQNPTVGGVWWENRYPGAGVDSPNHLYSFSFFPYDWKQYFCLRDEIHTYLGDMADHFDVRRHIRFETKVERIEYDADAQGWHATLRGPDKELITLEVSIVISAAGIFHPPIEPAINDLDSWSGDKWHSARWPEGASVQDKRVAIIGNGASAMQIGPEIQYDVRSLTIFQKDPQWAAPFERFRQRVPDPLRYLFQSMPLYRWWYRVLLGWVWNDRLYTSLQIDPAWEHPERSLNARNDAHRAYFTQYIREELGDRADELIDKVLPDYPPFGKRMLMDNGWYRMLRNPRVELVTDAIGRIEGNHIITVDGKHREADLLVFATGFDVTRMLNSYEAIGRSGRTLRETWSDDNPSAYLGTVVLDFPNFFILYGPNLQPGHGGSIMFIIETQIRYVMDVLHQMMDQNLGAVEVRTDVHNRYNADVDARHERMVWKHPGMTTYYRNRRGRVVVNSPYRNVDFYYMMKHADLDDYEVEARVVGARVP